MAAYLNLHTLLNQSRQDAAAQQQQVRGGAEERGGYDGAWHPHGMRRHTRPLRVTLHPPLPWS